MVAEKKRKDLVEQKKRVEEELLAKKAKIDEQIEEIDSVKTKINNIRPLKSFTVEEKVKEFDRLYNEARGFFDYLLEKGYFKDDFNEYGFEALMEILDPNIWEIIRTIEE